MVLTIGGTPPSYNIAGLAVPKGSVLHLKVFMDYVANSYYPPKTVSGHFLMLVDTIT